MAFAGTLNELNGAAAASAKVWVSGMTVNQYQTVRDPNDRRLYIRKTATGGGTTPPWQDLVNYEAADYDRITGLVNAATTPGTGSTGPLTQQFLMGVGPALSNIAVNTTRQLLLDVTGKGGLTFLGLSGFARPASGNISLRMEVEIDGRPAIDVTLTGSGTTVGISGNPTSSVIWGSLAGSASPLTPSPWPALRFMQSLKVYGTYTNVSSANMTLARMMETYA